jgi:hypothetical protein
MVFWVVTPCSSDSSRRFGGTYRLHLQVFHRTIRRCIPGDKIIQFILKFYVGRDVPYLFPLYFVLERGRAN